MKFKSRLDRLEAMRPIAPWMPPIFFHPVVEPTENGPREVGAFAKIYVEGKDLMVWRREDETNEDFELRVLKLKVYSTNLATKWLRSHSSIFFI